ncbi:hypothetical protein CSV61_06720 [Sporosarcina sp. P3]|uniref:hypothetical protein n=1 Tax=Sporosarcina sp. P3 TaxID=2048245 RepID=UPI000C16333C|nr:hypothetical protein [Sporosarcina sp. P3]PID21906.1 hypothetical protein CSV61_06720 [Sporosarcina sp. P3]
MIRDERLSLNHYSVMHHRIELEKKRSEYRAQYDVKVWRDAILKSVQRIINHLFEDKLDPFVFESSLSSETNYHIQIVEEWLKDGTDIMFPREAEMETVLSWFGEILAENSGADFVTWEILFERICENHILAQTWMQYLPIESIQKNENELAQLPNFTDPLELTNTWGLYHDKQYWSGFSESMESKKNDSPNTWEFVNNTLRFDNEFIHKPIIELKSTLLFRCDKSIWVKWLSELPFLQLKDAVLEAYLDFDLLIELLEISLKQSCEELSALLIWKYLDLAKHITGNLEKYSSDRWTANEADKEFAKENKKELEKWKQQELPERITDIGTVLIDSEETRGTQLAINILQTISIRGNNNDHIHSTVRKVFISRLVDDEEIKVHSILNKPITESSLISATLFLYEKDSNLESESTNLLWDAYLELLLRERFYWHTELNKNQDDFLLLWLMGGILSEFLDSQKKLAEAMKAINAETEGWRVQPDLIYALNKKAVHLLICGAMSAEWMHQNQKVPEAQDIFNFVFHQMKQRIRLLTNHDHEEFYPLILQVWSRLPSICPDDYVLLAQETINEFDNLDHILLSLTILRQNILRDKTKIFDPQLIQLMKTSFDAKFPFVKIKYAHLPERIQWYESFDWWEE